MNDLFNQQPAVLTVSALVRKAKECLESSFPLCWIRGEISNLITASSGHIYFTLKDPHAQLRCVMFRHKAQLLGWKMENGQQIEVRALATLYEARGDFQLNVESVRKTGIGLLYEKFIRLKEKFEKEGLFSEENKKTLPIFPKNIGIITSSKAAALQDVLTTLKRRSPHVVITFYPVPVQGEESAKKMAIALEKANQEAKCELLLLCRGGGSIEDLWAFNEEILVRAIANSAIPIVTGIGHETDFTLADFAADKRAPTPTAAAELAAPLRAALLENINQLQRRINQNFISLLNRFCQQLDLLENNLIHPTEKIKLKGKHISSLEYRLHSSFQYIQMTKKNELSLISDRLLRTSGYMTKTDHQLIEKLFARLQNAKQKQHHQLDVSLERLGASLEQLNPEAVLARGYSIVRNESGKIINNSQLLNLSEQISVHFNKGHAKAKVTKIDKS